MSNENLTYSLLVDQSPAEVFAAVNNVRGWWSEVADGSSDKVGAKFDYYYQNMHRSTQTVTEWIPGKKVVWRVSNAFLKFVKDKTEWEGTEIVFDIARKGNKTELRFTHVGLLPTVECYGKCSGAWGFYVTESLLYLIVAGKGQPTTAEEANTNR